MMQKSAFECVRLALIGACLVCKLSGAAIAATSGNSDGPVQQTAKAKKKKAAKAKTSKVKFLPGSEESKAERRARLKMECKGAANAGVCTGYTR
ncbi:MAG: hypothetical protein V4573_09660 [Pseudomonadota bacterium]